MSLKENISMVKAELNTEEQFFEQAVKTERFVKKYKKPLAGAVAAIMLAVGGTIAYDAYTAAKRDAANAAYLTLLTAPDNQQAQQTLRAEAPLLFDAWRMAAAISKGDAETLKTLSGSPAPEIADISAYTAAAEGEDTAALGAYTMRQGALYRDLALIDEAVLMMRSGKSEEAHQRLKMIDAQSPLASLASALAHYGVK